jgi:hypothetical protein
MDDDSDEGIESQNEDDQPSNSPKGENEGEIVLNFDLPSES